MSPVQVRDLLNPGQTRTLSDATVQQIVRRTEVMAAGLSSRTGVRVVAGKGWAADPDTKVLIYDLGTAAILNDRARSGVIGHEAGHLRFTKHYDKDRLPFKDDAGKRGIFHDLANCFEDRRMEKLMAETFPGLAGDFEELAKTFDIPELQAGIEQAPPALQFLVSVHRMIYGRKPITTHPEVLVELNRLYPEIDRIVHLPTTQAMADALLEPDGFFDTIIKLKGNPPPEEPEGEGEAEGQGEGQGQTTDPQGGTPAEGGGSGLSGNYEADSPDEGAEGEAAAEELGEGDDDEQDADDDDAEGEGSGGEGEGEDGEGESSDDDADDGEGASSGSGKGDDGEDADDEDDSEPGVKSGKGETHVDQGGGSGTGGDIVADAEFAEVPELDEPEPAEMTEALAALTEHQRAILDRLLEAMEGQSPEVRDVAEQVKQRLDAIEAARSHAGNEIERHIARGRHVADDRDNPLDDDEPEYRARVNELRGRINTLARGLKLVLRENSFDRWSVAGYKSGPRLHNRKLVQAAQGNLAVYRRKERPKNRRYAVALAIDVSGSMNGHRLEMARRAAYLLAEACERAGIKVAVYAFGNETLCIKPYDQPLAHRAGKMGTFHHLSQAGLGSHTCMGWAMKRCAEDLLSHYGDDTWRKLVFVVTDGMPNACQRPGHWDYADPRPFVRELETRGTECVGIGVQENGVKSIFPNGHIVIGDVGDLPKTLIQALRQRVRRG
jgi:uncharacterized protein YegL